MTDINALKRQRQSIKAALTRIYNYCIRENAVVEEIVARGSGADELFRRFEGLQVQIDDQTSEENQQIEDDYRADIEQTYYSIKAKVYLAQGDKVAQQQHEQQTQDNSHISSAIQALMQHQSSMSVLMERFASNIRVENTSTPEENTAHRELRLPRVNLPEFDGNILEWVRFKELFEAFVHNRTNLSNIEKLEYLNTKLKGDALSIIKHLNPTASNYVVAWDLLYKKYNDQQKIKSAYMELLFDQPAIRSPTLAEIKRFYNSINEGYNALKALDDTVEQWNSVLLFNIEKKLDYDTAKSWYRESTPGESSTFAKFLKFLEKKVFELENMQGKGQNNAEPREQRKRPQVRTYATTLQVCPVCSSDHFLYHCDKFIKMSVEQRRDIVKRANICFNCLRGNHKANDCELKTCKKCDKKHNTLLHMQANLYKPVNNTQQATVNVQQAEPIATTGKLSNEVKYMSANIAQQNQQTLVILPTAIITIANNNYKHRCRALLDTGSQITLISEACVQRLGIKRQYDKTIVFGLGNQNGQHSRGKVQLKISASGQSKVIEAEALCLANLTRVLPAINIHNAKFDYFRNLTFADPEFHKESDIDIILGADVYMECCLAETIAHPSGSIAALNTIFGWVLMGRLQGGNSNQIYANHVSVGLDRCLQRFWELEEIPLNQQQFTPEEEAAEMYFKQTTKRLDCGRYEVRLPFKNGTINIGESKNIALKRLQAMERKFKQDKQLENDYKAFMHEYIQLGHMQAIDRSCRQVKCFLPHHAVIKQNSTTSKTRVVFDASSRSSNGLSLNDNLLIGPKVQRDLFDILISFRMNEIAYVGDIEKMYRQVTMHKMDRLMQCILWRDNESESIQEYTLNTVTYGTAAASFLATRTLNQIAIDNTSLCLNTVNAIKRHFYVDDFMHSSEDLPQAIKLKDELCTALLHAGFHLRKWSSNSADFLGTIPEKDRAMSLDAEIQHTSTVPTLGLMWNTKEDFFKFSSITYSACQVLTKRTVLSDIAKIYDPMGWLSPTVIFMKIFIQKLWLKGINWDEPLADSLVEDWHKIRRNIEQLPGVKVNRWLQYSCKTRLELHGFSDASEVAYAAAVYAKVYPNNNNKSFSYLIAAKTRVAPVKQVSLPRLELCGAHLLVKLMSRVRTSIGLNNIVMHGWTDSTIVLAWISDHPRRWKTFIANRTSQIIDVMPAQQWHHIRSLSNPADLATRGISTTELISSKLWWHGPDEIHADITLLQICDRINSTCDMEERQKIIANTALIKECSYIERYSNFTKLIRITALLLRFVYNCKTRPKCVGFLSTNELRNAHDIIAKLVQKSSFSTEIKMLSLNKQLPSNHSLAALSPFIDSTGLLRVGGRLNQAEISYAQKHPIILDKRAHLTKIMIRYYHITHCHAGKRLLQYIVQLKYWVPAISSVIKEIIYKCAICMRQRAVPYQQQMGELPKVRVTPAPVFSKVGIDFAEPFLIRAWKGRGGKTYKCWLAIFICLVTKAIHIELVTELSTAAFIASLRRFISRRGKPLHIYTDNGTNFLGASHELKDLYEFLQRNSSQDSINKYLTNQQINWHFIPPGSPNFGGLWEAGVKAIKFHLKRVLKDAHPTYEEMHTTLCQIEGCLNSRPLCIKFEGDMDPLTPAHFIILRAMDALPDRNIDDVKENRLSRWQYIQRLVNLFWKKWSVEYLNQLQQRHKWKATRQNVGENDVVIIKNENTAPSYWLIGKVIEAHPGPDGLTRVVTVKTKHGIMKRPINKLCPLFQES